MERRIINCIYLILLVFLGLDAKANLIDTNKVSIQNLYPKGFTSQCLKMNGSAVTWGSCGSGGGGGLSNVVINNGDLFTTITNGTLATNGTTLIRVSNGAIFNGSLFTTYFNTKSTTNLSEGTNLYYTGARVNGDISDTIGVTTQAYDADLSAVAALSGTGFAVRTASNTWTTRNISFDNGITLTNNGGVAGNPRITQDLRLSTYTNDSNWSAEANGGTMRSIQITTDNGITSSVTGLSGNGGALRLSNNLALSTYTNDAGFLTGNQTITLSSDVTGSGTTGITTTIANSAITTGKISNGAVGTVDLANSSITSGKILNGTILVADIDNGTHGYYMKSVNGSVVWATAGSSDAATLDGLDSTQFLRSDTSDNYTSGTLTLDAGTTFDVNSTAVSIADTNISFDGASTTFTGTGAMTITPGAGTNFLVQQSQNGTTQFKNSSGSVIAILNSTSSYGNPSVTSIFGDSVIKFQENGRTQWAIGFKANGDTFRIDDSGLFANNRFVMKNDGNVGIGIATPVHKLSVAGTINATGNITGVNLSGTNTGDQTITLTGDVTGSGTGSFAATIVNNAVTSGKISNGAVTSADLASSAVGTSNIAANAVTSAKISNGTIIGADLANADFGSFTVSSGTATIDANSITSAMITNATVATADIASSITLTTPNIGAATGTSLTLTGKMVAGTNVNGTTFNATKLLASGTFNGVSLNVSNGAAFLSVKNIGNGGTTEAFDFTKANKFIMALNASTCAISASTDPRGATSLQLMIQQRAGSQTVTWTACGSASGFCWPGGTAPTLTTSANAIDVISCLYNPTKDRYYCNSSLDFR